MELDSLAHTLTMYWPKILSTLIILLLAWLLHKGIRNTLQAIEKRGRIKAGMVSSFDGILRWLLVFLVLAALLQNWGVVENAWTALSGMLALIAIGFVAVWSVLSNALCSVIILFARPFRIGEYIEFPADEIGGRVFEVTLLHTTLHLEDGGYAQIPNNQVYQKVVLRYPDGKPDKDAKKKKEPAKKTVASKAPAKKMPAKKAAAKK